MEADESRRHSVGAWDPLAAGALQGVKRQRPFDL